MKIPRFADTITIPIPRRIPNKYPLAITKNKYPTTIGSETFDEKKKKFHKIILNTVFCDAVKSLRIIILTMVNSKTITIQITNAL